MSKLTAAARTAITAIMIGAASIGLAGAAAAAPAMPSVGSSVSAGVWSADPATDHQDCATATHTEDASAPCAPQSPHRHQLDGKGR
jgi:hypothetical protein